MYQVIQLHPEAPAQPAEGAPCNGCGVCCASEPCPLGAIASGRRHGACAALVWNEHSANYRCGLIERPAAHLPAGLRWGAPLLARLARRSIASGIGCDAGLGVEGRDPGR